MENENKRHRNRIRNMIIISVFTAIIISISTYAWFIGMRTVDVSSFDVKIASTDDLLLSLDGSYWDTTVSITEDTIDTVSYAGHTNWWAGRGLIPMSTVGKINSDESRLILFEKASLTATPGGYRLLASQVPNDGASEVDGYVAFDLFIRNYTGAQYIPTLNQADEEAIYLSTASKASVSLLGGGVANTGIENSVRVAFAQIGRVIGTETNQNTITGITCDGDGTGPVTGICSRTAQIWEPNDKKHEQNAINWYTTSCKKRDGSKTDITKKDAYFEEACTQVEIDKAYPTYAVNSEIISTDNVDVYDGAAYNGYTGSTKLTAYPYFTDTMKDLKGTARPEFMTLAPNSITKLRIYIYIEGQDVDNYDFASIGRKISVEFGFTKQRMTGDDFQYDDPLSSNSDSDNSTP